MVLWPKPWKDGVVPWAPVLAGRPVWTPRVERGQTLLTRGELLRWREYLAMRCTPCETKQAGICKRRDVHECVTHKGVDASKEPRTSRGIAKVMCWMDEVERDGDYDPTAQEKDHGLHDFCDDSDAPFSSWMVPLASDHVATRSLGWPASPRYGRVNYSIIKTMEGECHRISSLLPMTAGIENDLWGGLGHFSHAFTAEAIQDDKLVKVHVPDDSKHPNAVARAWFFSVADAMGMAKAYTRCLSFHGVCYPNESVCVFLPLPAARLALKAWAATEPAHLARTPGGCLSCLRDVPIEIDGVALFDCITLPGTSQQLQNCSSFDQVQLLARWLTEERLASAVPAVMQSLRALPHSGLWLLEQLQIGGNARKLLKEPTASSPSNNTSAAASAPENNGSAVMEENHSQGAASHENNQNAAMEVSG